MDDDDPGLTVTITDNQGALIIKWVTVAEVVETDGERSLRIEVSDEMPTWDVLGLLGFATQVQHQGGAVE